MLELKLELMVRIQRIDSANACNHLMGTAVVITELDLNGRNWRQHCLVDLRNQFSFSSLRFVQHLQVVDLRDSDLGELLQLSCLIVLSKQVLLSPF